MSPITKPDVAIVNQMPDLDRSGKVTGPERSVAEKIYEEILKGGGERVVSVVNLLTEIDRGDDYKARYVLHGLAVYLCQPGREKQRQVFNQALVSSLGGERPKSVQGFLVRQLQVSGDRRVAGALGKLLGDGELCEYAAQALLAIREGAVEEFRRALGKARGKNRRTIVQALGVLGDAESIDALAEETHDEDPDTRAAALWALATLGRTAAVAAVLAAADKFEGFERIRATDACFLLAEKLRHAGQRQDAARVYAHLRDTRTEVGEAHVREAALRGLGSTLGRKLREF